MDEKGPILEAVIRLCNGHFDRWGVGPGIMHRLSKPLLSI